jgi:hypothetical protein
MQQRPDTGEGARRSSARERRNATTGIAAAQGACELVLTVRVEVPDELMALLRQLAMPTAAPTRAGADKTWTEARKEALRRLWPTGKPIGEVRKVLEHLPGGKLPSNTAIAAYANGHLGVSRPPGFRRGSRRRSQSSAGTPK